MEIWQIAGVFTLRNYAFLCVKKIQNFLNKFKPDKNQ